MFLQEKRDLTNLEQNSEIEKRPSQYKMLYEGMFGEKNQDYSLNLIGSGILKCIDNTERLLIDAKILKEKDSFSTSAFLTAIAKEELAKIFILLDMARLDFVRNAGDIKKLCKIFYDHVAKDTYIKVHYGGFSLHTMKDVKDIILVLKRKWMSGDYESGEPDMPHESIRSREWNLYTDFSYYDNKWSFPILSYHKTEICLLKYEIKDVEEILKELKEVKNIGLFSPEYLGIFHEEFSKIYISEKTSNNEIKKVYECVVPEIERQFPGVIAADKLFSFIAKWPLYSIV